MDDGGELIGLIDAASHSGASLVGEELCWQAEEMAEGGDDQIGFHSTGDFGAEVIRAKREEVAGGGDEEE